MKMKLQRKNILIPIDLIIEIFLRLPVESIARFRCVSKLWGSLLCRQDFTELFFTKSSARPQLLFACEKNDELFFFSANQPQNPDENSSVVIDNHHLAHFPCDCEVFAPVNGFFCLGLEDKKILNGREYRESVSVICNPSTEQSFTLPKWKTKRRRGVGSYLGYDPTKKHFKVLSMTWLAKSGSISEEHQIMTLGTDTCSWKMVECCIPHYPGDDTSQVCINGVVYYKATINNNIPREDSMIVCFDFRSEKFNILKVKETFNRAMPLGSILINYNGKLGLLMQDGSYYSCIDRESRSFELWVLEDNVK